MRRTSTNMSRFTDSLRQHTWLRVIHVFWTAHIYPGARTTLYAALCALFLTLAGTTFSFVPLAQAAGDQAALSTPLALTALGLKGTPSVVLDNQGYFHLLYQTDAP